MSIRSRQRLLQSICAWTCVTASIVACLSSLQVHAQTAQPAQDNKSEGVLTLVAEGAATAVVVTSGAPSGATRQSLPNLLDHFAQISDVKLKRILDSTLDGFTVNDGSIVPPKSYNGPASFILLGKSTLTDALGVDTSKLGPGGIIIRTYPNALVLIGTDDTTPSDIYGTRYALTQFLEDVLGVRYLWPGELGKVVPRSTTIAVPALDVSYTPIVQQRRIRWLGFQPRIELGLVKLGYEKDDYINIRKEADATKSYVGMWPYWHRLGGSANLASGHAFDHAWEKYGKDHPEWFAMQPNGSRAPHKKSSGNTQFCVSNLDLIDAIAAEKIKELNNSQLRSVSLSANDGSYETFCLCDACEALDPKQGVKVQLYDRSGDTPRWIEHVSMTDRYVFFWNEITKRIVKVHPDAYISVYAYSTYTAPPLERKLHPNIAVGFTGINYMSDKLRDEGRREWDGWAKAASKMYFRPNLLLAGRRQGTPVIYVHKMAEDFKYMAHHSMFATDFDSCVHNWATQGLNYYVLAKLHWNPDLDVDKMIDDYCKSGFGNAAEHVKSYLMDIEALTDKSAADESFLTDPYTPEVIVQLRAHLEAAAKADVTEAQQRRIAFLRRGLEFSALSAHGYRLLDELKTTGKLTDDLRQRSRETLDQLWKVSREIFENDPFAVNVAYAAWGGWGSFGKLGWNTEKMLEQLNATNASNQNSN